jgi:hypothetical protein
MQTWQTGLEGTAKLLKLQRQGALTNHLFPIHMVVFRHTHAVHGQLVKGVKYASSSFLQPRGHVVTSGKVHCHAKIGNQLGPHNPRHELKPLQRSRMRHPHHRGSANMCIWRLPKGASDNNVGYSVTLKVRGCLHRYTATCI